MTTRIPNGTLVRLKPGRYRLTRAKHGELYIVVGWGFAYAECKSLATGQKHHIDSTALETYDADT